MKQNKSKSIITATSAPFTIIAILILSLTACSGGNSTKNHTGTSNFDKKIYTPRYASGFSIEGAEGMKSSLITIENPWQGAKDYKQQLFIMRDNEAVPEGFQGQVIEREAKRIVCMSSTQTAMLEAIGEEGRIAGVSGIDFISSEKIRNRKGEIADIGYDGNIDYERLMASRPDIVLLYGVDSPSAMEPKLRELKIPYIYIGDYVENSPLGKAEWVRVIGEIAGCGNKAETLFNSIPLKYDAVKSKVAETIFKKGGRMPKVMLNSPYHDTWYVPSPDSYIVRLITDAGGDYLCSKEISGNASQIIDMEKAYMLVSQADYWMNIGSGINTLNDLKAGLPKFANIRAVKDRNVYDCNKRSTPGGGNDFYESGIMHPDVILNDLALIFHPETGNPDSLAYYRRLP